MTPEDYENLSQDVRRIADTFLYEGKKWAKVSITYTHNITPDTNVQIRSERKGKQHLKITVGKHLFDYMNPGLSEVVSL